MMKHRKLDEPFGTKIFQEVRYVRVGERGMLGVAFRKGIELNQCEIVGYMDIDLSTDLIYLWKNN